MEIFSFTEFKLIHFFCTCSINDDPNERGGAFQRLEMYIDRQIEDHVANPRDDLTNYLLNVAPDRSGLLREPYLGLLRPRASSLSRWCSAVAVLRRDRRFGSR